MCGKSVDDLKDIGQFFDALGVFRAAKLGGFLSEFFDEGVEQLVSLEWPHLWLHAGCFDDLGDAISNEFPVRTGRASHMSPRRRA